MARPKNEQPTPGELEVLQILWDQGESSVRDVWQVLEDRKPRAYTSVMSLLNVMTDKGLVKRRAKGRAFLYRTKHPKDKTLGGIVRDLVGRAFEGSSASLVANLLDQAKPTADELAMIREALDEYERGDES